VSAELLDGFVHGERVEQCEQSTPISVCRGIRLETLGVAIDHDLDCETGSERNERRAEQPTQLVLVRQPEGLVDGDRIERPLGGSVEAKFSAGRKVVRFDGHVAQHVDLFVSLNEIDAEGVSRRWAPLETGVTKRPSQLSGDQIG